jgi:hypothetical protein
LLAEMFAFCIAAAHLELPHQLISSLMVSDVSTGPDLEGWTLVDAIAPNDVCARAKSVVAYPATTLRVPQVVHMCQRYGLGLEWFFTKHKLPSESIYDCETPLFAEPPDDLATSFDYKVLPPKYERKSVDTDQAKRMSFILCYV